jgi:anti-sigma factor RsiW
MSMPTSQPSPLQQRLSAYADGEIVEQERHDIDALLVNDPQARTQQDQLKRGADVGRRFFEDLLKEPVPLELVRTIKNAPLPRRAVRLPQVPRPPLSFHPSGAQTLAACLIFFALGGGIGYMFATNPAGQTLASLSAPPADKRDWLDDVIADYRLFGRQPRHMAEIGPDGKADILEWLTNNTGVGFRIPDLAQSGLTFAGARLVTAQGHPLGLLFYKRIDGDSDVVAIAFASSSPDLGKPMEDIRSDTAVVSWATALATYVVVGPSSAADLDDIAAKAAGLI